MSCAIYTIQNKLRGVFERTMNAKWWYQRERKSKREYQPYLRKMLDHDIPVHGKVERSEQNGLLSTNKIYPEQYRIHGIEWMTLDLTDSTPLWLDSSRDWQVQDRWILIRLVCFVWCKCCFTGAPHRGHWSNDNDDVMSYRWSSATEYVLLVLWQQYTKKQRTKHGQTIQRPGSNQSPRKEG